MRPTIILLITASILMGCSQYTEATSPCFGQGSSPDVTRAAQVPLSFVEPARAAKDCDFQPMGGSNG